MRLALPIWNDRLSPVFDTAACLLVIDLEGKHPMGSRRLDINESRPERRAALLVASRVQVLLCGAISRPLLDMLSSQGIKVTPFLTGRIEDIVRAFQCGELADPRFIMPGCCRGRGHGRGRRQRRFPGRKSS
jgi:predicted Fe-Mo cluster-binding NifX family protein